MTYRATLDRRTTLKLIGASCIITALKGCTVAELFTEAGEGFTFDLSDPQFSALTEVGQMVAIDSGGREVLLVRRSEDEIIALNRKCTHQGYDLGPDENGRWSDDKLTCTVHFSIFDHTGAVLSGLATEPLDSYAVSFDQSAGTGDVNYLSRGASSDPMAGEPGGAGADGGGGAGAGTEGGGGAPGGSEAGMGAVPEEYRELVNPFADDLEAAAALGEAEYVNCVGCHGAEGVSGTGLMPPATAFNVDQSEWSDGYLFWRIKEGGAGGPAGTSMPAFGSFMSDDQMWQLVSYIRSLSL